MPIVTNLPNDGSNTTVPKGQDMTIVGTVLNSAGALTSETITTWTFICEIRTTWGEATTVYSNITPAIDNTLKTVTFTILKADTQDLATGKYRWHIRRTGSGVEKSLGHGTIDLGADPPAAKTA